MISRPDVILRLVYMVLEIVCKPAVLKIFHLDKNNCFPRSAVRGLPFTTSQARGTRLTTPVLLPLIVSFASLCELGANANSKILKQSAIKTYRGKCKYKNIDGLLYL